MEDYIAFLAEVRKSTNLDMLVPDNTGLVTVSVDDRYTVSLQYLERTGEVLCFVEVAELGADAPKEIYRSLLSGCLFGRETAGGYFALEPETETVVYNYLFNLHTAANDVDAFVDTLDSIIALCDKWAERIKNVPAISDAAEDFGGGGMRV